MAKLESLVIDLQLSTASLKKSADDAVAVVSGVGKKISGALAGINFASVAAGLKRITSALLRFVADGARAADQTTVLGKRAGEFTENAKRLQDALHSVGARVAIDVGPAFTRLTNFLFQSKAGAEVLNTAVRVLGGALRVIATIAIGVGAAFSVVGTALAGLAAAFTEAVTGNFDGAIEIVKGMREMMGSEIATAGELIKTTWADAGDSVSESAGVIVAATDKVAEHLAEVRKQSAFEFELKARGIDRGLLERQENFGNIGKSSREVATAKASGSGFDDFNAAAAKAADAMTAREKLLSAAAEHHAAKEFDLARRATEAADAQEVLAKEADGAADAFAQLKELDLSDAKAQLEGVVAGLASVGTQFASKLGDLGDVINAGIQGAQSGGVWGALIAVIIELLSKFEGFSQILDIANGTVQMALKDMASGFGDLVKGLRPVIGAVSGIAKSLHSILGPILSIIGKLFEQLAGTLVPLGIIMQQIGSSLSPLFTIIGAIVEVLKIFQPILSLVSLSMLGLKLAMEYVNLGFQMFLDWVLEKFGNNNNSGVDAAYNAVNATQNEIIKLAKQLEKDPFNSVTNYAGEAADELEDLGKVTEEVNKEKEKEAEAVEKTTTALDRLSAQFTNVPRGFRLNARTFQSSDTVGGPMTMAGSFMGGMTVIVQGSLIHEKELLGKVDKGLKKSGWQKTGLKK